MKKADQTAKSALNLLNISAYPAILISHLLLKHLFARNFLVLGGNFENSILLNWFAKGHCHWKLIFPHFSNLNYGIKIALVHGGADAEQTEFAVFNNCCYSVFFSMSKRNADVETSVSVLVSVVKYRISVRFCGISIRE